MLAGLKKYIVGSRLERLARRLYIRLDQSMASHYDRLTLSIMRRHLKTDSNCLDIGAHRGTILAEIVRLAPNGTHYAFEPVPEHYQYLAAAFPTVQVRQLALGNVCQQTTFIHDRKHPTRSSFKQIARAADDIETITVQTDLLDNIIPAAMPIHFIKMDVEGAEYQVIQGAINTIRVNRPLIVFEHTRAAEEVYGVKPEAIYDLLTQECGLHVFRPEDWLSRSEVLSRGEFMEAAEQSESLYFVAYP